MNSLMDIGFLNNYCSFALLLFRKFSKCKAKYPTSKQAGLASTPFSPHYLCQVIPLTAVPCRAVLSSISRISKDIPVMGVLFGIWPLY